MNKREIILRYWWALRYAIENFVAETSKPYQQQNGTLIRCLRAVVDLRMAELDQAEGKI